MVSKDSGTIFEYSATTVDKLRQPGLHALAVHKEIPDHSEDLPSSFSARQCRWFVQEASGPSLRRLAHQ